MSKFLTRIQEPKKNAEITVILKSNSTLFLQQLHACSQVWDQNGRLYGQASRKLFETRKTEASI